MARAEDLLEEYWPVLLGAAAVLGGAVWYSRSRQLSTEQRAIVLPSPQIDIGAIVNAQAQLAMAAEQSRSQLFQGILAGALREEEIASEERVASLQAQSALQIASLQMQRDVQVAQLQAQSAVQVAQLQAQQAVQVAQLQAQQAAQIAQLQADIERKRIDAQLEAARLQAQAQMEAAARQAAAQQQQSFLGFLGTVLGALIPLFSVERTRAFQRRRAVLNRGLAAAYPWAFQGVH